MIHGKSAYNNHGCRCPVCKAARAAYDREYAIRTDRNTRRRERRRRLRLSGDWRTQP